MKGTRLIVACLAVAAFGIGLTPANANHVFRFNCGRGNVYHNPSMDLVINGQDQLSDATFTGPLAIVPDACHTAGHVVGGPDGSGGEAWVNTGVVRVGVGDDQTTTGIHIHTSP